jgi:hypothetical protein
VDDRSVVTAVRVVTGDVIARLDTTGTLTKKFQAKSKTLVATSQLVTQSDAYALVEQVRSLAVLNNPSLMQPDFRRFLPIAELYEKLRTPIGKTIADPGLDQERNRGGALHEAVCAVLGMTHTHDTGSCPDVIEQLLEVKLQTSPTIDLGLVSPDDDNPLVDMPGVRHSDVRYAVFYGTSDGTCLRINNLVLCSGRDFFSFFQRFEGKVVNAKLQIPLSSGFFGETETLPS